MIDMKKPFNLLLPFFHEISPYDNFDPSEYDLDLQGWGNSHPVFKSIIESLRPELVIEVGTWKGASAIHMSNLLKTNGIEAAIICVDTWLGNVSHWSRPEWRCHLRLKNGYPSFYYQFLANVKKSGHDDMIIPVPQSSRSACEWLRQVALAPNVIYLDGSHDEVDVYLDCRDYWELLAPNGVLFGDDYGGAVHQGVKLAVDKFCEKLGRQPTVIDGKWILTKPA